MQKKKILSLVCLLLLMVLGGEVILSAFAVPAEAATVSYSNVLEDLSKADNFRIENYPNLTLEYFNQINSDLNLVNDQEHLQVIQIAESTNKELYIYVYQPCHSELDLTGSAVLLSTEFSPDGQHINPSIYNLELVSTDSVFDKYRVKDFRVSEEPYRYYNIVALYRNFNPDIDEITPGGVIENFELGIDVGQQWCAYYENNTIRYEMNTFDTVEVSIGYTGNVEFSSGFKLGDVISSNFTKGDAWFIAFNVEDYIVTKIYDADLTYKIRDKTWTYGVGLNSTEYSEWSEDKKVTLSIEDNEMSYQGDGILAKTFKWNTIMSSTDFVKSMDEQEAYLSDEAREHLKKNQWVFCFLQTERKLTAGNGYTIVENKNLSAVTVIRLHFMDITGTVYNLGAVSDRVSPDDTSDIIGSGVEVDLDRFKILVALLGIILFLVVFVACYPLIKVVFGIILTGLKVIFRLIVSIIFFPFGKIFNIFKKP